jgi:hypothetical protein
MTLALIVALVAVGTGALYEEAQMKKRLRAVNAVIMESDETGEPLECRARLEAHAKNYKGNADMYATLGAICIIGAFFMLTCTLAAK